jgi:hypothetical protein
MVSLLFGQSPDSIDKIERLLEIGESKGPGNVMFVDDLPIGRLRKLRIDLVQFFTLERWHAATAGNTRFAG